jgi:hypothetical protein
LLEIKFEEKFIWSLLERGPQEVAEEKIWDIETKKDVRSVNAIVMMEKVHEQEILVNVMTATEKEEIVEAATAEENSVVTAEAVEASVVETVAEIVEAVEASAEEIVEASVETVAENVEKDLH